MMSRECEEGKPKIMTGVGSMRLGGEERGAEPKREGMMSGGGEGEWGVVVVSCFVKGEERVKS